MRVTHAFAPGVGRCQLESCERWSDCGRLVNQKVASPNPVWEWDRYFKKKTEAEAAATHRVTTAQVAPDTIVVRNMGRDVETITAADLATLDPNSRVLIKALEDSMQRQFEIWTAVYPTRDSSPDPVVNAQVDRRLKDIARTMCQDLGKIFAYLDSMGKHLEDHYGHVRYLCLGLQQHTEGP